MSHDFNNYEQVRLINTSVHSCGLARNIGLDHATGEYIWFMDGDDWLLSATAIEEALNTIKSQDQKIIKIDYEAPNFSFYGYPSMVWQYIMRRDFIGNLRFTEIQPDEDVKFMGTLLCDLPEPIHFLKTKLYYYNYMREGSNMY
jgi:glycosyltransferase involved in cell wall biosynthesis